MDNRYKHILYGIGVTPINYLLGYILPSIVIGICIAYIILTLFPYLMYGSIKYIIFIIPLVFVLILAIYPYLKIYTKTRAIMESFPLFITHMGVLATANLGRIEILNKMMERKEYGPLRDEFNRIQQLTKNANISFGRATKIVATTTPSRLLAGFMHRVAHSAEAGEEFGEFIQREEDAILKEYETSYLSSLRSLDMIKELLVAIFCCVGFIAILGGILPFITGRAIVLMIYLAVLSLFFVGIAFTYVIQGILPKDPIWSELKVKNKVSRKTNLYLIISILFILIIGILTFSIIQIPSQLKLAITITPLYLVGHYVRKEQGKIREREEYFSPFVRSLGTSTGLRGGSEIPALNLLRRHDFGELTENINLLYKRLHSRVASKGRAWLQFGVDSCSNLITEFSQMFMVGSSVGGDAKAFSKIISDNIIRLGSIRKQRAQSAGGLRAVYYGVCGVLSFIFCMSCKIIFMVQDIITVMGKSVERALGGLFSIIDPMHDVDFIVISFLVIIPYAITSAIAIQQAEGGHRYSIFTDFVILTWVGSIVWVGADIALDLVIKVGGF